MSILIQDSPRNLAKWVCNARSAGTARGGILTPFETPRRQPSSKGKRDCFDVAAVLKRAKAEVWFDATTHALQMSGVGDFRWYDDYKLWPGARGDLSTQGLQKEHVRRVFKTQDELQARHLGPTILLHAPESTTSQQALDLAREAVDLDPKCWLSVAGTAPFWSGGRALDSHIGALAQLEPAGWFLTVVRPNMVTPVEVNAGEVEGLCRTTRALSEYAPVHISHGDLAALPAVAAGASSVGSGWDQRQRVCAFSSYAPRTPNGGGGAWYKRQTLQTLLGSLFVNEAAVLKHRDSARVVRLGGLPTPGPTAAYLHHLKALHGAITTITASADPRTRHDTLARMYKDAAGEWPPVMSITGCTAGAPEWVGDLADGLARYGTAEGW